MIKKVIKEYKEGDVAFKITKIYFLYILIYKKVEESTNNLIVEQLMPFSELVKINELPTIKGFKS